jgi:4-hydroxy 2-oxovalerate aldolase
VVNYSDYAYYRDMIADNCILMLLRLLDTIGVKNVAFAGFDGFGSGPNFALSGMERDADHTHDNNLTRSVLDSLAGSMNFTWVTPSIFGEI